MSLGDNIRNARKAKNMSQKELSDAISNETETFGNTTISNWENNINQPDADTIASLCKVLDVDANFLLDFDNQIKEIKKDQLDDLSALENVLYTHKDKIDSVKNLPVEKQKIIANAVKSVLDMIDDDNYDQ